MSKLLLLTSLALMAAAPVTQESAEPTPITTQVLESKALELPKPLQELREASSLRLRELQEEFAKTKDPQRARELQRSIRNEKLGFEASLIEYQLERATTAEKTDQVQRLRTALDSIRRLMKDELEQNVAPVDGGEQ